MNEPWIEEPEIWKEFCEKHLISKDQFRRNYFALNYKEESERYEWFSKGWKRKDKTGNVSNIHREVFPIKKRELEKFTQAIGIVVSKFIDESVKTLIINGNNFAAYNFELSPNEMKVAVDSMDETGRITHLWETKELNRVS